MYHAYMLLLFLLPLSLLSLLLLCLLLLQSVSFGIPKRSFGDKASLYVITMH